MEYFFYVILAIALIALTRAKGKGNKHYKHHKHKKNYSSYNKLSSGNADLETTLRGGYSTQKILNRNESIVYKIVLSELRKRQSSFRCFVQVSCGEILKNVHSERYSTINCKRVDFCIADASFTPIAVIEYNGTGHSLSGDAGIRDSIKKSATEDAGILYRSIYHGDNYRDKVIALLDQLDSRN